MMLKNIIILIILAISCKCMYYETLDAVSHLKTKELFKIWHYLNNKSYSLNSQEALNRYRVFKETVAFVKQRNSEQSDYKLGLGPFADMSFEEFSSKMLSENVDLKEITRNLGVSFDEMADDDEIMINKKVKTDVDWSSIFGYVRDQGHCGSCWTFGVTAPIEAAIAIRDKTACVPLSTQQLVDCNLENKGCNGGGYGRALKYIIEKGLNLESDYKYEAVRKTCKFDSNKSVVRIKSYKQCSSCSHDALDALLAKGPLSTAVEVTREFQHYRNGILNAKCSKSPNHAIVMVQRNEEFIKIRNSWGTKFGENGYIRIKHDDKNNFSCFTERNIYLPLLN